MLRLRMTNWGANCRGTQRDCVGLSVSWMGWLKKRKAFVRLQSFVVVWWKTEWSCTSSCRRSCFHWTKRRKDKTWHFFIRFFYLFHMEIFSKRYIGDVCSGSKHGGCCSSWFRFRPTSSTALVCGNAHEYQVACIRAKQACCIEYMIASIWITREIWKMVRRSRFTRFYPHAW